VEHRAETELKNEEIRKVLQEEEVHIQKIFQASFLYTEKFPDQSVLSTDTNKSYSATVQGGGDYYR
jgi:hypothetical protein